jgi:thiamine kinase-like enzyme
MTLIDWEPAGLGYAILDLGRLLLHAHQTLAQPNAIPEALSADFIHAVIEGYCQVRIPPPSERAILLEAIRFSVAFSAASHLTQAVATGWSDQSLARLRRRQQWFTRSGSSA